MKFSFGKKRIYCDSASTTPFHLSVLKEMRKAEKVFANPSSIYRDGVVAREMIVSARATVARILNAKHYEVVFTSGGTESNNLALFGIIENLANAGRSYESMHIISTTIEHSSILISLEELEKKGVRVTRVAPKESGVVSVEDIQKAITSETVLISVMYVNNEVGTIQPIGKIGLAVREENERRENAGKAKIIFHTDASQAPLALPLSVDKLGVHLMTIDGHKIYGPKGIGALYVKKDISLKPIMFGGGQEAGLRPATENLSGIVGFASALQLASKNREMFNKNMREVQETFLKGLKEYVPSAVVNGTLDLRVPQNINVWIPGLDAEFAVIKLDVLGISCSTKSSCLKGEDKSYVIYSMTGDSDRSRSSLRFTFLQDATRGDALSAVRSLARVLS